MKRTKNKNKITAETSIFADSLVGFKMKLVADPMMPKGYAALLTHPDDYEELVAKFKEDAKDKDQGG